MGRLNFLTIIAFVLIPGCKQGIERNQDIQYSQSSENSGDTLNAERMEREAQRIRSQRALSREKELRDRDQKEKDQRKRPVIDEQLIPLYEYPTLFFSSEGQSSCNGESYRTTSKISAKLSDGNFNITLADAKIHCEGECGEKGNAELQKALGITSYTRTSEKRLKSLIEKGFKFHSFLIYADEVTKNDGTKYRFVDPLPVFPLPQPAARFTDFSQQTYQTRVYTTGNDWFDVILTVRKLSTIGPLVTIQFHNLIQDNLWSVYEDFPIPYSSEYKINTTHRDVRDISTVNRWYGEKHCNENKETTVQNLVLCKKVKSTGSEIIRHCP